MYNDMSKTLVSSDFIPLLINKKKLLVLWGKSSIDPSLILSILF